MKPFIKIGLIVMILIIAGLIIYFVWSAIATPAPATPPATNGISGLPAAPGLNGEAATAPTEQSPAQNQNQTGLTLIKISEGAVFDYWIDPQTKEIYYLNQDGRVFSGKNGPDLQITQQKLNAVNFIRVAPGSQKVLAAFGDPRLPQWGIFDVIDKAWRPLPDGILNVTWGADSNTLIGFIKNGGNINLSAINLAQDQPTYKILIKDFRLQDVALDFYPPNNLLIKERPASGYAGRVWSLNLKDLSFHLLFAPENGLVIKMSGDGRVLFSFSGARSFQILNGGSLGLLIPVPFATLPSKCSPDSGITYCFVPTNDAFKNAVLPDDYFDKKIYTTDILYKINLTTDEVTPISLPSGIGLIDAESPYFSDDNLYFINRYDSILYSINLARPPAPNQ